MKLLSPRPEVGYLREALWIPKSHVNVAGVKAALTFNLMNSSSPAVLELWRETRHHLVVPRGFYYDLTKAGFPIVDARPVAFEKINFKSKIVLDFLKPQETTQRDAVAALLGAEGGILQLKCGGGKTPIALEVACRLGVPTLVIMDTEQLVLQWEEKILAFLGIRPEDIGRIQGKAWDWEKPIVLATYQTLSRHARNLDEKIRRRFGVVFFEEGHHLAAQVFSQCADLFYGRRYLLSATPNRADGYHVIYEMHVGPVLYKNLKPDLPARVEFLWSELELDIDDPKVGPEVRDKNGELHLSMLGVYYGRWQEHLSFVMKHLIRYYEEGRRILVLCPSVSEAVGLLALWNGFQELFGEIPIPTPASLGKTDQAVFLPKEMQGKLRTRLGALQALIQDPLKPPDKKQTAQATVQEILLRFRQHEVYEEVERALKRNQGKFIKAMMEKCKNGDAGLMIHKIPAHDRMRMLKEKRITFAVPKYGREGLDHTPIDTVLQTMPITDPGGVQQTMGRALRNFAGKKDPIYAIVEHKISAIIAMCNKIRRLLINWPADAGGPIPCTRVGEEKRLHGTKQLRT